MKTLILTKQHYDAAARYCFNGNLKLKRNALIDKQTHAIYDRIDTLGACEVCLRRANDVECSTVVVMTDYIVTEKQHIILCRLKGDTYKSMEKIETES